MTYFTWEIPPDAPEGWGMGNGEKWLKGNDNAWYYLLPDGSLHRWTGRFESSSLVGQLDATYHADPSKLYEAPSQKARLTWTVRSTSRAIS